MSNSITRRLIAVLLLCVPAEGGHAQATQAPAESLWFAVIGDFEAISRTDVVVDSGVIHRVTAL